MSSIETPLSCDQLKRRFHAAWWETRRAHPVVGVNFDADNAIFVPCETPASAKQWTAQTCQVASNTTVSDVYLALSRQSLDATTMVLVVDPARGARGCVCNMSHTLMSLEGLPMMQYFISQLAQPDSELGIEASFHPETVSNTGPRLPQSLSHAYSLRYQPTKKELQDALKLQERAQERWTRSSVGIPVHRDWQNRPSLMQNKVVCFEPAERIAASKCLKKMRVSITAAFFACITAGMAQTFGNGDEDGAHLLYSGNARRWIDPKARDGHGPITMGIIPGSMWIDAKEANVHAKDQEGLLKLARAIERAQSEDLLSPHIIGVLDQSAPALVKATGAPRDSSSVPRISRPTLTSQGLFSDEAVAGPGSDPMRLTECNTGGRNTDPSVCFALHSFRDELRYNLLFDERFFDQDVVMQLAHVVSGLFRRVIAEDVPRAQL